MLLTAMMRDFLALFVPNLDKSFQIDPQKYFGIDV